MIIIIISEHSSVFLPSGAESYKPTQSRDRESREGARDEDENVSIY